MATNPILLNGYDARRCARRVHNDWDPSIEKVEWEVPAELQLRFDNGNAFEVQVYAEIKAALASTRYIDLSELRGDAAVRATVRAMDDRVELILGGRLPDDVSGGRTGRPDALLLGGDGGYLPGDIKGHRVVATRKRGTLTYSLLGEPGASLSTEGFAAQTTTRLHDYLQLAHYWRMLEAAGRATGTMPTGLIVGTDLIADLAPGAHIITWLDLDAPLFETYSRSQGTARRSALQRYDHEQGFRLKVAAAAAAGEPALVQPVFTDECGSCPWYDYCREVAGDDVASVHITAGRLSVREWTALDAAGVHSIEELARLDVDDEAFQQSYLPEVTHVKDPVGRLRTAVRRGRMVRDDVTVERETTGPIVVPRADVEVDFDIEWDPSDKVYLWGALVHRAGAAPVYHPFVSWEDDDEHAVAELAREFVNWLRAQIDAADAAGQSLLVYHYTSPEVTYLKRILGEPEVADVLARFVDLYPIISEHYFGRRGLGIKQVAPAFGFHWRDEDPGGLQSQLWLLEARAAADDVARLAAQRRILDYNEDDVRATAAIRNGL